ncbi:MAG TPA: peptide-methionine (S)-S-oxide reductase MsrA [Candidatus Binatia bacterium]|nr:peptide-methionine (S)-S-oxide reductase MsrA [Candidatus Binatia bacterium]
MISPRMTAALAAISLAGLAAVPSAARARAADAPEKTPAATAAGASAAATAGLERAIFAGGCFWCVEAAFDPVEGVVSTTSGYTGGHLANPTYEQVSAGGTGHAESVEVAYDPSRVTYEKLLDVFWHNVDPISPNRQFCDAGTQYRSAIFYLNDAQREAAEKSKRDLEAAKVLPGPIVTEIVAATAFYPAEEYHQDYYRKNPVRYRFYRSGCGRDRRLKELWGTAAAAH